MHSLTATCRRTYTHADRLRATLAFAFLCSARLRLALAAVQARTTTHTNSYTQSTFVVIYANAGNMIRLHNSGGTFHTIFI